MRAPLVSLVTAWFVLASFTGCSSEDDPTGGAGAGTTNAGTSGATATGGTAGSGGATATGGTAGSSGSTATGGTAGSGGSTAGSAGSASGASGAGGASGGTAGAGGSTGGADSPADTTQAGIEAFLDALEYKGSAWAPDQGTTHDSGAENHGTVQSWFNRTLRQSFAGGDTRLTTVGSMVVKELYSGTSVIGHAVMLRTSETQTTYYCTASEEGRCYSGQTANQVTFTTSAAQNCGCHGGGTVITPVPAP